jgi:hypothetical protein
VDNRGQGVLLDALQTLPHKQEEVVARAVQLAQRASVDKRM